MNNIVENNKMLTNEEQEENCVRKLLQELLRDILVCKNTGCIFNKTPSPICKIKLEHLRTDSYGHDIPVEIENLRPFLFANFPIEVLHNLLKSLNVEENPVKLFLTKTLTYIYSFLENENLGYVSIDRYRYKINTSDNGIESVNIIARIDIGYSMRGNLIGAIHECKTVTADLIKSMSQIRLLKDAEIRKYIIMPQDQYELTKYINNSPEQVKEILNIIQLGLSEYSADKNLPRPLTVTIDISEINLLYRIIKGGSPEEYSDTLILTLNGKDYLEDILNYIRQYMHQDSDAEVELHSRLGTYTEHMGDKDDDGYNQLITNIFIIFCSRIIQNIIHECINKTPYLKEFFALIECTKSYSTIKVTSANHQDNNVFMGLCLRGISAIPHKICYPSFLKALLAFTAQNDELREKIMSIDDEILAYISDKIEKDSIDYYAYYHY